MLNTRFKKPVIARIRLKFKATYLSETPTYDNVDTHGPASDPTSGTPDEYLNLPSDFTRQAIRIHPPALTPDLTFLLAS